MKNSELLNYNKDLLSGLDRQRQYILKLHSEKNPCPNCRTLQNVFEARGIDIDEYDSNKPLGDEGFQCIACHRGLIYRVPLIMTTPGGYVWELIPETHERMEP